MPSYLHDAELTDETIGRALSSPLFIQARGEPLIALCCSHAQPSPAELIVTTIPPDVPFSKFPEVQVVERIQVAHTTFNTSFTSTRSVCLPRPRPATLCPSFISLETALELFVVSLCMMSSLVGPKPYCAADARTGSRNCECDSTRVDGQTHCRHPSCSGRGTDRFAAHLFCAY